MFIYLDESGDTGFKFKQGSSRYFVISLLMVTDPIPLHHAIDDLRKELGFQSHNEFTAVITKGVIPTQEESRSSRVRTRPYTRSLVPLNGDDNFSARRCKWASSSETIRWAFLRMIRGQDFSARILIVDKTLIKISQTRSRETFYNFLINIILREDREALRNATLILEESFKSKKSKQLLTTYLGRELNAAPEEPRIVAIRYHWSHTDNLIQAADMLSGAVYTNYHRSKREYLDFIRAKIVDLWEWQPRAQ